MQEFTVQLFDDGSAQISGTGANLELRFGYSKNAYIYSVKFIRSKEWEDLYIRVHFHPEADIYDVEPVLAQNNIVNIPAMITSMPGEGKLTIEGTDGYKIITSADIPYRVSENSGIDSDTDPEPGESSFQQFVDEVKKDAEEAKQAAKDAESALTETKEASASALTDIEKAKGNAISEIEKIETEVKSEIQEDVDSAKSSAEASSKSAEEAKTAADSAKKSLSDLETAKQSAISEISKEKDNSVSAIGSAKEAALNEISTSGNSAIQNVKTAETNAINSVETEGFTQKTALNNASNTALTSIDTAKTNAVKAVEDKASEESSAIDQKSNEVIQNIQNAGDSELSAISEATSSAIEQITQSAGQHLTQIDSAADEAVTDIMNAKEDSLEEIEEVNAHPPIQNPETGKWQIWNAETSSYVDTVYDWEGEYYSPSVDSEGNLTWEGSKEGMEDIPSINIRGPQGLGVPTSTANDYGKTPTVNASGTGYELIGPYAPLSAAITETAKGNPAVCEDSVEWSLQGVRVYGKSTQVTTTGAQLFDVSTAADDTWIASDLGETESAKGFWTSDYIPVANGAQYSFSAKGSLRGAFYNDQKAFVKNITAGIGENGTFTAEADGFIRLSGIESTHPKQDFMLNAGSTVKPWEPYTGGKPSPSPEYPQPIVSAGDGGNVEVLVTGKNLLDISKMPQRSTNGITFSLENGGIKISGTATANTDSPIFTFRLPTGTYISNINKKSFPWLLSVSYMVEKKDGSNFWLTASSAFTVLDEYIGKYFYFGIEKGKTVNEIIYPQLEVGSTTTPYEPYKSQSLTISTPNSLPGVPVDSGGNYTDADGQQWVCDEIDYARGVYVQRVERITFNGSSDELWAMATNNATQRNYFWITLEKAALRKGHDFDVLLCQAFPHMLYGYAEPSGNNTACFQSNNLNFTCSTSLFNSVDDWRQYLNGNEMTLIYAIANPIETPIPADELAAYRVLHTYDNTTVITPDDALAEVEVDYLVKSKAYIEKKLTAIESRLNALEISEALEGE